MKVNSIQEAVTVEVQRDALAAKLLAINAYCQKNKIGEWGASASEALVAHCDALAAQLKHQTERAETAEIFIENLGLHIDAGADIHKIAELLAQWLDADHGQRLAEVRAEVLQECQLIVARTNTTYRDNPGMGFSSTIEDRTAKDFKAIITQQLDRYAAKVRGGAV